MFSRTLISLAGVMVLAAGLSSCAVPPTRQQLGIGSGAVIGGVIGSALTGGSTAGAVGGAAAGGLIGNELSKPHNR